MSRKDMYEFIKENNLQQVIKETFGDNFTRVKSSVLETFIEKYKTEKKITKKQKSASEVWDTPYNIPELFNTFHEQAKKFLEGIKEEVEHHKEEKCCCGSDFDVDTQEESKRIYKAFGTLVKILLRKRILLNSEVTEIFE